MSYDGERCILTVPKNELSSEDVNGIKEWLTNHDAYIVYKTTNSTTYQLTPEEVTTLLGTNNIWADCGPSTVEYPCDTKTYVDNGIGEVENTLTQLDSAKAAKVDLTDISQTSPNCTVANGIAKGTYFYLDGDLARAKELINENATFTLGTNYELVTAGGLNSLAEQIGTLFTLLQNISISPNSYTDVDYPAGYTQYHTMIVSVLIASIYHDYTNINVVLNESKIRVYNNSSQSWTGVKILLTKI